MTKNQPVLTATLITTAVAAVLTLLAAFGVPLTEDQSSAINALIAILAPAVVGVIAVRTSTDDKKILEVEQNGDVLAGRANDQLSEGEYVRSLHGGE